MKRAALVGALVLGAIALFADLIASDLPLACRHQGRLYLLACVTQPELRGPAQAGDWAIATPIAFGPTSYDASGPEAIFARPSARHLLGTDDRGRDVAARLIHGSRVALWVGPLASLLVLAFALLAGLGSALSRTVDFTVARLVEVGVTFPALFVLLVIKSLSADDSLAPLVAAIALTQWPQLTRVVRAEAKRVAVAPHVEAARGLGLTRVRIAVVHILPLVLAPALSLSAIGVAHAVLLEAGLSFLGLGLAPPTATWGELLLQAYRGELRPWLLLPPIVALSLTVLIFEGLSTRWARASLSPDR